MKFEKGQSLHDLVRAKLGEAEEGTPDATVVADDSIQKADAVVTPDTITEQESSETVKKDTTKVTGAEAAPKEGQLYDVKIGDKVVSLTIDELIAGNMMRADYTRKTQEISRQRVELESMLKNKGNNVAPQQQGSVEPAVDPLDGIEVDDFTSEKDRLVIQRLKEESARRAKLEAEVNELKRFTDTAKGKKRLDVLKEQFDSVADFHGIPKKHFTTVAVYKRVGEMLPDTNGVPYGDRYTIEMAMNDVKGEFADEFNGVDPIKALESMPDKYEKYKSDIIEKYLAEKKEIGKTTFSPSAGGSQEIPATKQKFKTPVESKQWIKDNLKTLMNEN